MQRSELELIRSVQLQIAHDLQSPLAALKQAQTFLPKETGELLSCTVQALQQMISHLQTSIPYTNPSAQNPPITENQLLQTCREVTEITLHPGTHILLADEDPGSCQILEQKFLAASSSLKITYLWQTEDIISWFRKTILETDHILLLCSARLAHLIDLFGNPEHAFLLLDTEPTSPSQRYILKKNAPHLKARLFQTGG